MNNNNIFPVEELKARLQYLKQNVPTYPLYRKQEVEIKEAGWKVGSNKVTLDILLRIERKGVWYLVRNRLEHIFLEENREFVMEEILSTFHKNVYTQSILYIVDTNLKDIEGNPINIADTDQRSEVERLTEILKF